MTNQEVVKLNNLAEEVGNFIQYWGFKKVHGKVWTHLYLAIEPLDASELMKRLNISKSLVSITLNDLLQYEVIIKNGKGPKDTVVYASNTDLQSVIINVLKNRESQMLRSVHQAFSEVQSDEAILSSEIVKRDRVESLGRMISEAEQALSALIELKTIDFSNCKLS